jgi:hypothetical protein
MRKLSTSFNKTPVVDVEKIKTFLLNRYNVSTWNDFVDNQKLGDCKEIVKLIWTNFSEMFNYPVEIFINYSDQAKNLIKDGKEMKGNHFVLLNGKTYYDFARGSNCINGIYVLTQNNNEDKYDIVFTPEEEECIYDRKF